MINQVALNIQMHFDFYKSLTDQQQDKKYKKEN